MNHLTKDTKLSSMISVYKNALDVTVCDKIIKEYENDDYVVSTTKAKLKDFRTCKQINISDEKSLNKNYKTRKEIDNLVFEAFSNKLNLYLEKYKHLECNRDDGYILLKYDKNNRYKEHVDETYKHVNVFNNLNTQNLVNRVLTGIIQLNDDFEGGGLSFFEDTYKIPVSKGSLILFPSNFMFPHQANVVKKNIRLSLITWFYNV